MFLRNFLFWWILQTESKSIRDMYRYINGFKTSYQSTVTKEKDKNINLHTGSKICRISGRIIFSASELRYAEGSILWRPKWGIYRIGPLLLETISFRFIIPTETWKTYKSPESHKIPSPMIQAVNGTLRCVFHMRNNSISNMEKCHSSGRNHYCTLCKIWGFRGGDYE
jgi:hypothetical protein